ncbi:major facilitator superfamily domain-containing protein 8-like isoform X3 [Mytilus californianus]|uniref:major facilitator superfamily domain-containing protein 8-like isoform X3 n=1 Tax=Mytilus californianus TaxID=6549 RepID=UPI002246F711|nr:major facilitator superfamily domain-containing protein 8-like isoform X3 [Mytilus californianus]
MKNKKKKLCYTILGLYFFMGGVEYAVILPTLWLYLENTFHAQQYFLGLILSAFSLTAMLSGPMFGRWSDVTRKPKFPMLIGAVFEIAGNTMYFMGNSKWFLVASRLIAGVGAGAESVILAEISRVTTEAERTGILSTMIAIRQSGLLIGPGLNVFLRLANFNIGPFKVNKYTDPGAFMACLWALEFLLLVLFYTDLHKIKELELEQERVNDPVISSDKLSNQNPPTYDTVITGARDNYDVSADIEGIQSTTEYEKQICEIKTEEPVTKEKLSMGFFYKMYVREEIVTLLGVQFISLFSQVSLETMATPLSNKLLHWGELENSVMYCCAGVEIILVFILVRILSKHLKDRTMILMGCFLLAMANGWLMYVVPRAYNDTPAENIPKFVIGIALDMLALPFLFTCSMSLYTKLLPKEIQGLSQGLRRTTVGLSTIIAPLWAGSTLRWPYLMFGVMLSLLGVSLLMLLLSFSRLLPTSKIQSDINYKSAENIHTDNSSAVNNRLAGNSSAVNTTFKQNSDINESTPLLS